MIFFFFSSSAAYSYPIATLSRTMNPYTNSILEYVSFTYKVLESNRKIRIKLGVCYQGLSETAAALAVAVTRTEFNHEDPGTPRRVGGEGLSVSCGYLGGLCCSQQVLDLSSSELKCLLVPVGAA